jgi:hypothetical protein
MPSNLSGENGLFRAPWSAAPQAARNDYDAIHTWLSTKSSEFTQTA